MRQMMRSWLLFELLVLTASASAEHTHIGCFNRDSNMSNLVQNSDADIDPSKGIAAVNPNITNICGDLCHRDNGAVFGLLRNGESAKYAKCYCGDRRPHTFADNCVYKCPRYQLTNPCGGPAAVISLYTVCSNHGNATYFGENCSSRCYCQDNQPCLSLTGSCPAGCADGYYGPSCSILDVNECDDVTHNPCGPGGTCENNLGSYTCVCQDGFRLDEESQPTCTEETGVHVAAVVGAVVGGVVTLAAIIGGVIFWRRKKTRGQQSESMPAPDFTQSSPPSIIPAAPERRPITKQTLTEDEAVYANSTLVTCEDFPHYVKFRLTEEIPFGDEYDGLPDRTAEWTDATRDGVKSKNRFINLYPYDHNRVSLNVINNDPLTDYINASFVDGYRPKDKFIASSGPRSATVEDFWRMIVEKDVQLIVMLTRLKEARNEKCIQYWPEEKSVQFGSHTVFLTKQDIWPDYIIRKLRVTDGRRQHHVNQLHYMSWPDHGVPSDATALMNFRRTVARTMVANKYTVVHCSAGVGRTGTLIALDYLLRQTEAEAKIDVMDCVTKLRHQRICMVQTREQYVFIHEALALRFTVGETIIPSAAFSSSYLSLTANQKDNKSVLDIQFQELDKMKPTVSADAKNVALNKENISKNRDPAILPLPRAQAHLLYSKHNKKTYINAVFVHGFQKCQQFIATQYPLNNTVHDFWRLVLDFDCRTIVVLRTADTKADLPRFLPSEQKPLLAAGKLITQTSSDTKNNLKVKVVSVTDAEDADYANLDDKPSENGVAFSPFSLMLFELDCCSKDTILPPSECINTFTEVQKWLPSAGDGPALVTCRNGATFCGQYIAGHNLMAMINSEQEVDVFLITKKVKDSRPEFISTQEQFKNLYSTADEYIRMFDTYSNFK